MSHSRTRTETRIARHARTARGGLNVADLRAFLADVDAAEIDDDALVRIDVKSAGEGGNTRVAIEAQTRIPLDEQDPGRC